MLFIRKKCIFVFEIDAVSSLINGEFPCFKNVTYCAKPISRAQMKTLVIDASPQTPQIHFDAITGVMEIRGRSIPDQADEFWLPILNWFEGYLLHPLANTVVKIDLEYFNISSSKRILFLLYKLNELSEAGKEVHVEWYYRQSDEDMYEVGQDYAYMVKVPFIFKEYIDPDIAIAI